ncbi:phosphoglycerate kinase, cytosolic isoform X2 [Lactuca sativa]|uniref:Phosphoglycerate kinase n=1 Tax=Lactuca sativa TaxID=4236 RepID=A0A9R1XUR8_LACSA|nr:phosphoglycerate kinase, cytosolic isoform X2 [Lactuca sativa]KAJ0222289.1 hypothetical protein LSAT_V11C200090200 [Lactuca sativa]
MSRILDIHHCRPTYSLIFFTCKSQGSNGNYLTFKKKGAAKSSLRANISEVGLNHILDRCAHKVEEDDGNAFNALPHVKRLSELQKDDLFGKIVMVRFDSNILLEENQNKNSKTFISALSTIKYLHEAGATVILISSWSTKTNSNLDSLDSVSAYISSLLKLKVLPMKLCHEYESTRLEESQETHKPSIYLLENLSQFKEDIANNSRFSQELSSRVDIFINDAFFQSHKTLSSTVGVTSFCYASVAGFQFEEGLSQLKKAFMTKENPYIAMVGGGNLIEKAAAINYLVSSSDGLIFVGNISFQIMHALGFSVPNKYIEFGAFKEAIKIIKSANSRNIPIFFPKDFWCMNDHFKNPELVSAECIPEGWTPFGLGPNSLEEITTLLSKSKKIVWIGPVKFGLSNQDSYGTSILAKVIGKLSQENCDVTVIGNMACKALMEESMVSSNFNIIENASVVWEFLKGRKLPGLMALDRGYPYSIDWRTIYADPDRPLFVDIGSGNGMFLFGMARKRKDMNFLGLEMNGKLVKRCLETCHLSDLKNGYFIETNATSTFGSIVSCYPGKLVFASIQCPNPDFNRPEHRWKMVQRSLIEAILHLLSYDGKVFLQSDIEGVALRMKEEFLKYGNGKFIIDHQEEWLKENPFGVQSDWEKHVLDNGAPMYRLMLSKSLRE